MTLPQTIIRFPEIKLQTRDAHKLRGFFGNLFRDHSPLLHNHLENEGFRYAYPQVQYKVIEGTPTLVGILEGAGLLKQLFLKIDELKIGDQDFKLRTKQIETTDFEIGISETKKQYKFLTRWMALNQKNHNKYLKMDGPEAKKLLCKTLTGNCLSFFKNMGYFAEQQIVIDGAFSERKTGFKNQRMLAFEGSFTTNVLLPDYIGLGKQVGRGFGTILKIS